MKLSTFTLLSCAMLTSGIVLAQEKTELQYFRQNSKEGLNVFETPKEKGGDFDKVRVFIGGDFALQFQSIDHSNGLNNLVQLGSNFNLPSANLNINTQLADGLRLHLKTYLSSKHHNEAWVKGGYLQIDRLGFIKEGFMDGIMDFTTITFGMDEFNYGDAHFRRSDNARAIYNPFIGNYIMDSFSTEAFGEVTVQKDGLLAVVGLTNGKLNQNVIVNDNTDNKPSFYGKLGVDKYLNEDFRFRLTGSWYLNNGTTTGSWLYGGDRAGGRYYNVLQPLEGSSNDFEGRFNPRFKQMTAFQINPFLKYKGLEFFGIFESVGNSEDQGNGQFTQLSGELLYRFGGTEQFYVGGRYNTVKGKNNESDAQDIEISRVNVGGGWFMTKNVIVKLEYMKQEYKNGFAATSVYNEAKFNGVNLEAAISF
ncbi:hypothetical protein LV84_01462 [Algoriphagus ratkowskyi]|uniref:Phosphate-selective porin O/P n=2 Tax=Pseudomonadati TaxID=3379134 RepID=A0A2W7RBA5_9BACT|nr:hypothetical protein [Algoriphagus ratkowskyi]PZX58258.1 hypothetical protein LV84_01462 [Algoriphagus ratkowskyi]TXD77863.1 hypothetical protein ESW18_10895 [Algoriphagus ratkowskyi]